VNIKKDIPTREELNTILYIAKQKRYSSYLLFRLLSVTGKRLGEFVGVFNKDSREWEIGMSVNDVYPEDNRLSLYIIKAKKKTKSGNIIRDRYKKMPNFIPPDLMVELVGFINKHDLKGKDVVFRGSHVPCIRTFQRDFIDFRKEAGILKDNITIHSLRHYVVSFLRMEKDMPYETIAERFTKHKSIDIMRKHYAHIDVEKQKDKIMKNLEFMES